MSHTSRRCFQKIELAHCGRLQIQACSHMLNDVLHDDGGLELAGSTHGRMRWPIGLAELDLELESWDGICLHSTACLVF